MSAFNVSEIDNVTRTVDTTTTTFDDSKDIYYAIVVPIMLVLCFLSMVTNLMILVSIGWVRRSLSPTMLFSVSLAGADAYASLLVGTGLVINSLLPVSYNIRLGSNCYMLVVECLRLGGLIVSMVHLLLLAFNHYIGIIRPLHYASNMTRRNAMFSIVLMWTLPVAFFFCYAASVPGQGFQSVGCYNLSFVLKLHFRVVVSCLFFVPLALMTLMYCHIYVILRKHNKDFGQRNDARQFRRNVKAVVTTLLILGTFVLGWMPAVLFFVVVCDDCAVRLRQDISETAVFFFSVVNNTLMIIKFSVNPIVYAARMKDIRVALHRMAVSCCPNYITVADDGSSSVRSRTDTIATSLRMHSVYVPNKTSPSAGRNGRQAKQRQASRTKRNGLLQTTLTNSPNNTLLNMSDSSIEHSLVTTDH